MSNNYNLLHFAARPSPERHPDRLAAISNLLGLKPKDPKESRILELACGTGQNLVATAEQYPKSKSLGIDIAEKQLEIGETLIRKLGLKNIELRACDLKKIDQTIGKFDYIIAHGILSWVPLDVRNKIFQIFESHLEDNGVGLISFNALPGWETRSEIRESLLENLKETNTVEQKVQDARDFIRHRIASLQEKEDEASEKELKELQHIEYQSDAFILHELLNNNSNGILLGEFISTLNSHNLHYVSDARAYRVLVHMLFERELEITELNDQHFIKRDLHSPRALHSALISKRVPKRQLATAKRKLADTYFSSPFVPAKEDSLFYSPSGNMVSFSNPEATKIARTLAKNWPKPIKLELNNNTDRALLELIVDGVVDIHHSSLGIVNLVADKPQTRKLARLELEENFIATNNRHEYSQFNDIERQIFLLLNGEKNKTTLLAEIKNLIDLGKISFNNEHIIPEDKKDGLIEALLDELLEKFRQTAYLK